MIHWLEANTLGALFAFVMWTLILGPIWRKIVHWGHEVRDLLDSGTPGGLGDIERRLQALEKQQGGES